MQTSLINGIDAATAKPRSADQRPQRSAARRRADQGFAEAQKKTRAKAQDFEAMFLNSMFSQMTTGVKGEGPFGDTTGHRRLALDADGRIFEILRQVRRHRHFQRRLPHLILQQANRAG